jgi:hypothetical protein
MGNNTVDLEPGKPVVFQWSDPKDHGAFKDWADVSFWGYHVTQPGSYTITAIPLVEAFDPSESQYTPTLYRESNRVRITVLK